MSPGVGVGALGSDITKGPIFTVSGWAWGGRQPEPQSDNLTQRVGENAIATGPDLTATPHVLPECQLQVSVVRTELQMVTQR